MASRVASLVVGPLAQRSEHAPMHAHALASPLSRTRHEKRRARRLRRGGQASWWASVVAGKRRGGQAYYEPQELRMTQYLMPEGDSPQPTTSTSWSMSFAVLGVLLGSMYTPSFSAMLELNE